MGSRNAVVEVPCLHKRCLQEAQVTSDYESTGFREEDFVQEAYLMLYCKALASSATEKSSADRQLPIPHVPHLFTSRRIMATMTNTHVQDHECCFNEVSPYNLLLASV